MRDIDVAPPPPSHLESHLDEVALAVTATLLVLFGRLQGLRKSEARSRAGGALSKASPYTVKVEHGGATLFRARFSGFAEQDSAQDACNALKRNGFNCFATRS